MTTLWSKNTSLLSGTDESSLSFLSAHLPFNGLHAGPSGSSIGRVPASRPTCRKESDSFSAIADTMKVVGIFDHQFDRFVPKVLGHVISIPALSSGIILQRDNGSSDLGLRGRRDGPSYSADALRRNAPAAGARTDHPRHDAGRFHENAFLLSKGAEGITSDLQGLVAVKGHVAGLQRRIVNNVTIAFRPCFQKIDGVLQARNLFDKVSTLLQINGPIKYLRVHLYLTENVGDQQGWLRNRAPTRNLFSTHLGFKIGQPVDAGKFEEVAA